MPIRPKSRAETRKAAEWVSELARKAAEGALWEETPPVSEQLADHFARLGLTDNK